MKKILTAENRQYIERIVLEFFSCVKRPILVGEVALDAKRSLEEVETVMNGQVQRGVLRKLRPDECAFYGWCSIAAAYALV